MLCKRGGMIPSGIGKIGGIFGAVMDVTPQRLAQTALEHALKAMVAEICGMNDDRPERVTS
jgi:hypothetical protein